MPDLPEAVGHILSRGTQKAPADRFQSAAELVSELNRVLGTRGDSPPGVSEEAATVLPDRDIVVVNRNGNALERQDDVAEIPPWCGHTPPQKGEKAEFQFSS